ncbi:MAG: hypothetical protein ACRD37_01650, partial [Candidatus Acidiferrales bacterium]
GLLHPLIPNLSTLHPISGASREKMKPESKPAEYPAVFAKPRTVPEYHEPTARQITPYMREYV